MSNINFLIVEIILYTMCTYFGYFLGKKRMFKSLILLIVNNPEVFNHILEDIKFKIKKQRIIVKEYNNENT